MTAWLGWFPLAAFLSAGAGGYLAGRLAPRRAAQALVALETGAAGALLIPVLGVSLAWATGHRVVTDWGGWDSSRLPANVEAFAGPLALVLLIVAMARVTLYLRNERVVTRRIPHGHPLVILDDPEPVAFAAQVDDGVIVVSQGLLDSLDEDEQRALLAHEQAHLRCRHDRYLRAAGVAGAAVPIFGGLTRAVRAAVERWADEEAVCTIGDRAVVARAVLVAAVATSPPRMPAASGSLEGRVSALLSQPRPIGPMAAGCLTVAVAVTVAALTSQAAHLLAFSVHLSTGS